MITAVLIDGAFFLKRYQNVFGHKPDDPTIVARNLHEMATYHAHGNNERSHEDLYRILYYDCEPILKKVHNPVTQRLIDFSKTPQAIFRLELFAELKQKRKVALRLGYLNAPGNWLIFPRNTKELLKGLLKIEDLEEHHIHYEIKQKGVDIKIGLDIASLAYKKLVRKIVLISGDSDFVPAAKLARREGIDFVLDPMMSQIEDSLFEHIDGLKSFNPRYNRKKIN